MFFKIFLKSQVQFPDNNFIFFRILRGPLFHSVFVPFGENTVVSGYYLLPNPEQSFLLSKWLLFPNPFRGHYTTSSKSKAKDKKVHVAVHAFSLFFFFIVMLPDMQQLEIALQRKNVLFALSLSFTFSVNKLQYVSTAVILRRG